MESCPTYHSERPVYSLTETGQVVLSNPQECIFCRECVYYLEDIPVFKKDPDLIPVSIKHGDDKFTFTVEVRTQTAKAWGDFVTIADNVFA